MERLRWFFILAIFSSALTAQTASIVFDPTNFLQAVEEGADIAQQVELMIQQGQTTYNQWVAFANSLKDFDVSSWNSFKESVNSVSSNFMATVNDASNTLAFTYNGKRYTIGNLQQFPDDLADNIDQILKRHEGDPGYWETWNRVGFNQDFTDLLKGMHTFATGVGQKITAMSTGIDKTLEDSSKRADDIMANATGTSSEQATLQALLAMQREMVALQQQLLATQTMNNALNAQLAQYQMTKEQLDNAKNDQGPEYTRGYSADWVVNFMSGGPDPQAQ